MVKSAEVAKKFICSSITNKDGFFIEVQDGSCCHQCKKYYNFMHKTTNNHWCALCYINRFCDVITNERGDSLLKMKNSTKVIFTFQQDISDREIVII